ncbi:MAG: DUF3783 domain-containing protein [Clostridiales bacterium]|nr:DUF3783 domain-containing protein [Clostridiales bacterium]
MKARISQPKEQVLFYNIDKQKSDELLKLMNEYSIEFNEIKEDMCGQTLGYLLKWNGFEENNDLFSNSNPVDSECLIFCRIDRSKMNNLLSEIRKRNLNVDLKAGVTASNQSWKFHDLLLELQREHNKLHNR